MSNVNSVFLPKGFFFNWKDGIVKFDIHDSSVSLLGISLEDA